MSAAIEIRDLSKRYGQDIVLDNLNLTIDEGEIYGFLGPNGAGKSTTIDMIMDFRRPNEGTIRVFGMDPQSKPRAVKRRVGVLPDGFNVHPSWTGREHLDLVIGTKRSDDDPIDLLNRVGLHDVADRAASDYSKGMRQRLGLAMALVGTPDLLILDEPFTGLDPQGTRTIREITYEEHERGATVFFSSHVLGQVELICDQIGILDDGQLTAEGTLSALREEASLGPTVRIDTNGTMAEIRQVSSSVPGIDHVSVDDTSLVVQLDEGGSSDRLETALEEADLSVKNFTVEQPSMEAVFLAHIDSVATQEAGQ